MMSVATSSKTTLSTQKVSRVSKEPDATSRPTEQPGGKHSLVRSWRVTLRAGGYKRHWGRRSKGGGKEAELGIDWVSPQEQLGDEHTQTPSSLLLEACGPHPGKQS